MFRISESALAAIFLSLSITTAAAQPVPSGCREDGESIIAELQKDHGEEVVAIAVNAKGNLIRVLADAFDGSWSFVVTLPVEAGGTSPGCITDHGGFWQIILPVVPSSAS